MVSCFFLWNIRWPAHVLFGTTLCHYVWGLGASNSRWIHWYWSAKEMTVSAVRSFRRMQSGFRYWKRTLQNMLLHFALKKLLGNASMHFSIPLCDVPAVVTCCDPNAMSFWPLPHSTVPKLPWLGQDFHGYIVSAAFLPGAEWRTRKRSLHFRSSGPLLHYLQRL